MKLIQTAYYVITAAARERLLQYENERDCRFPVGFADHYVPTDDCLKRTDGNYDATGAALRAAKIRKFVWLPSDFVSEAPEELFATGYQKRVKTEL